MDDLSFCSSCLICAKLCVHPKARLELNDFNLPTPTRVRTSSTLTTSKESEKSKKSQRTLKQQISSFAECTSKFCELFNSPDSPRDNSFQKDFTEFFQFTTLSSNCPVCENCQQRIRLISKVMIQIESLQAQLIKLKESVEKDLSVQISAENGSEHIRNNEKYFIIDCGRKTKLFREKLKEKLQNSSSAGAGSNAVGINDVVDSAAVIPEINSYLLNNEKFFIDCGRKTKLFREKLQKKLQIAVTGARAAHAHINDAVDSAMIPSEINRRNSDTIVFNGVADTEAQFPLNEDCLTLMCNDFVMEPRPINGENAKDSVDDSIEIPICGVSSDDEEIHMMEVIKTKKKLGRRGRLQRKIHWRQLKVKDVCFPNANVEEEVHGTVMKPKSGSLKRRDADDDDYLPESESSSEGQPEESTTGSSDDSSDTDCSSLTTANRKPKSESSSEDQVKESNTTGSSDDSDNDCSSLSTGSSAQTHRGGSKGGGSWSCDSREGRSSVVISSSSDDESLILGPLTPAKNVTARPELTNATNTNPRPGPSTPKSTTPRPGPSPSKTTTPRPGPGRGKGGKKRKRGRPSGKSVPSMLNSEKGAESMISSSSGSDCASDSEGDQPNPAKRRKKALLRRRKAEKRRRQCY